MFLITMLVISSFVLIVLLKLVSSLISESVLLSREELTPYECGFEHHNLSRVPFSLRYLLLTLVFLLFDLEIVLMLFLPTVLTTISSSFTFLILFTFILILILSLLYEWNDGSLEWLS